MLADVGCNVPMLDDHDRRVIEETRAGTTTFKGSKSGLPGLPDSQEDVGGWEDYPKSTAPPVGIPMATACPTDGRPKGISIPMTPAMARSTPTAMAYTNLEDYLNCLAGGG